jgi:hypothetical protein
VEHGEYEARPRRFARRRANHAHVFRDWIGYSRLGLLAALRHSTFAARDLEFA